VNATTATLVANSVTDGVVTVTGVSDVTGRRLLSSSVVVTFTISSAAPLVFIRAAISSPTLGTELAASFANANLPVPSVSRVAAASPPASPQAPVVYSGARAVSVATALAAAVLPALLF
jgi:hypothetical protein